MSFVMPPDYTLATLPEPLDASVSLKIVPNRLVAALKYSGTWSRNRFDEKQDLLEKIIRGKGLIPIGEPVFARYNPPWTPWFLRRNEVLIPVEKAVR
ncbi:MAG: heme-binding protein [Syntrophobacteraceae bacterium]